VKYICFHDYKPEDLDKIIPLFQKMEELRAKGSPDYPKPVLQTHTFAGETSGFAVYEVDNLQQITNHHLHYHPLVKHTWKPITEASEYIATYMKRKK